MARMYRAKVMYSGELGDMRAAPVEVPGA